MRRALLLLAIPSRLLSQDVEAWQIIIPTQTSVIFARDGSMIGEIVKVRRFNVSLRTPPRHVDQAFVAVEDRRFYKQDGVDLVGDATATKDNLLGARPGASTITLQLA